MYSKFIAIYDILCRTSPDDDNIIRQNLYRGTEYTTTFKAE